MKSRRKGQIVNKKERLDGISIKFSEISEINSSFAKGVCAIAYTGENVKGFSIPKETFEKAVPTLKNVPIVGYYDEEENSFAGHKAKIIKDKNNKLQLVNMTIPFGVVPESANQWWSKEMVNGEEKDTLFTDVILWKRMFGFDHIEENKEFSQSMEIDINEMDESQDIPVATDITFTALCILEGFEPAFDNARITLCSKDENKDSLYEEFLDELNELYGGKQNMNGKTKNPTDAKFDNTSTEDGVVETTEDVVETGEDVVEETNATEEPVATTEDTNEPVKDEEVEETEDKKSEKFTSYNTVIENVNKALRKANIFEGEDFDYDTWVRDIDGNNALVSVDIWEKDGYKYETYIIPFEGEGENITFGEPKIAKMLYLTEDSYNEIEKTIEGKVIEKFSAEKEQMGKELEELKSFKEEFDKAKKEELYQKYSKALEKNEDFQSAWEKKEEFSVQALEDKFIYLVGVESMKKFSKEKPQEPKKFKFSVKSDDKDFDDYGGILKHYED